MEILKTGVLVKHRFSWPVTSAAAVLSIAITAAPALSQASGDQTPTFHSERKSVMTMKTISRTALSTSIGLKGSLLRRPSCFRTTSFSSASCERVWRHIVEATKWPEWYPNSKNVQILGDQASVLKSDSVFRWTTFNLPLESRINEFVPFSRIGWFGYAPGTEPSFYHTWYLAPQV
jgi:hypothetical protein